MLRMRKAGRMRVVHLVSDLFDGWTVWPLHPAKQPDSVPAWKVCSNDVVKLTLGQSFPAEPLPRGVWL